MFYRAHVQTKAQDTNDKIAYNNTSKQTEVHRIKIKTIKANQANKIDNKGQFVGAG